MKKTADLIRIRDFKKEANTISDLNSETDNLNKKLIEEEI
jgi:hypothetical protein